MRIPRVAAGRPAAEQGPKKILAPGFHDNRTQRWEVDIP